MMLLSVVTYSYNNIYYLNKKNEEKIKIETLLDFQQDKLKKYLKNYDEKILLIQNILSKYEKEEDIINFIDDNIFQDKNILTFKIIGLNSKEVLKINNNSSENKIVEYDKLRSLFADKYYKNMRTLKIKEILHYCATTPSYTTNFIIRDKNYFYSIKVDLKNILDEIENSYINKITIIDPNGGLINKNNSKNYKESEFFSRKVNVSNEKYFTLIITPLIESKNEFLNDYYKKVLLFIILLTLIVAYISSFVMSKLNKEILEKNKKLDLDIKETNLELYENERIMDNHIMFLQIDNNRAINEISNALSYFLGFSKNELIGHDYNNLMNENMSRVVRTAKKSINIKNKTFLINEYEGFKKNGDSFVLKLFIEGIFRKDEIIAYNIICTDVTARKKVENLYKDLNIQVDEYNAIFDNVDSGVALLDLEGNFVKINNKMSKLLGYENLELLKLNFLDVVSRDSKKILSKILSSLDEIGTINKIDRIFIRKDQTPIHLELSLKLLSSKNRVVFVINSLEDKIKLQELNANLEERIKQELEKSKEKDKVHHQEQLRNAKLSYIGALAAGIVHEINTPLTYIKGNLELMRYDIQDLPETKIKEQMLYDSQKMAEGINRIGNIIESMREMSQSNKEIIEEVNIYSTLITAITMAYNRSKQVSKVYLNDTLFNIDNIDKNLFSFVSKVQKQRVEQVWIIILSNALDELVKVDDYEKRVLDIKIFEEENEIVVRFKDNAGGIKLEIMDTIFEAFVSLKDHSGMGIGLNIAKKIIDEQDGQIKAFNEDSGAVFEVRLKSC